MILLKICINSNYSFHFTVKLTIIVAAKNPSQIINKIIQKALFILNLLNNSKMKMKTIIIKKIKVITPILLFVCQSTVSDNAAIHEIIHEKPIQTPVFMIAISMKH